MSYWRQSFRSSLPVCVPYVDGSAWNLDQMDVMGWCYHNNHLLQVGLYPYHIFSAFPVSRTQANLRIPSGMFYHIQIHLRDDKYSSKKESQRFHIHVLDTKHTNFGINWSFEITEFPNSKRLILPSVRFRHCDCSISEYTTPVEG